MTKLSQRLELLEQKFKASAQMPVTGFRVIADGEPRTGRTIWRKNGYRLVDISKPA